MVKKFSVPVLSEGQGNLSRLATMPKTLPVQIIQENVDAQLGASQDIYRIVLELAKTLDARDVDEQLRTSLERTMETLLDVSERLSESASKTGDRMLDFLKHAQ